MDMVKKAIIWGRNKIAPFDILETKQGIPSRVEAHVGYMYICSFLLMLGGLICWTVGTTSGVQGFYGYALFVLFSYFSITLLVYSLYLDAENRNKFVKKRFYKVLIYISLGIAISCSGLAFFSKKTFERIAPIKTRRIDCCPYSLIVILLNWTGILFILSIATNPADKIINYFTDQMSVQEEATVVYLVMFALAIIGVKITNFFIFKAIVVIEQKLADFECKAFADVMVNYQLDSLIHEEIKSDVKKMSGFSWFGLLVLMVYFYVIYIFNPAQLFEVEAFSVGFSEAISLTTLIILVIDKRKEWLVTNDE